MTFSNEETLYPPSKPVEESDDDNDVCGQDIWDTEDIEENDTDATDVDEFEEGDPGLVDPGLVDPRLVDPRLVDPRLVDPRLVDPGMVDPGMVDLAQDGPELNGSGDDDSGLEYIKWLVHRLGIDGTHDQDRQDARGNNAELRIFGVNRGDFLSDQGTPFAKVNPKTHGQLSSLQLPENLILLEITIQQEMNDSDDKREDIGDDDGLHEQFSRIKLDSGPGPEPSQEYAGSEAMEID
ncbi:hypothetical protein AbraIFM66950_000179 [Aspergillus brasiliensis]|nr:hypothetical protein AbraIFM66950_000179 [Aspergillus brasiliensis]